MDVSSLPHTFIHGDIRSTNIMRHSDGKIYIIDFSVANWYPRIIELAVMVSCAFFDTRNPEAFEETYRSALVAYENAGVDFSEQEKNLLPLFVKLSHAVNVIGASSEDATNYISKEENKHWLELGRKGLQLHQGI